MSATKNEGTEYVRLVKWIVARVGVLARRNATKNEWEKLGREIEARAETLKRRLRPPRALKDVPWRWRKK